jgi:hypothetical protein
MIIWALLAIPTVLIWRESILWVAFMSLYANFVGHFSGWDGARAEQSARENNDEHPRGKQVHGHRPTVAT